jgi:Glycosyltransferase family 87
MAVVTSAAAGPPAQLRRVPLQTWAAVLAFCLLWTALGSLIVPGARHHDFLNLYTGASLALDGNFAHIHSPQVQLERERQFVPVLPVLVPFVRPPFYALFLAPLALLPFGVAFWIWLALQSALLFGCWAWACARWGSDALVFGALFLPSALGIASGQDCVVLLAILIATYSLAEKGSHFSSGVVLGLGLIKFHLFLLWPLGLIVQKRWRMLLGASAMAAAELLVSLWLSGPRGLLAYAELLRNKSLERLSPSPELMINVESLVLNLGHGNGIVHILLIGIVVLLVAAACWRAPLWRAIAATSAGSLLVPPHVYGYDAALLLLSIWLVIFSSVDKWKRIAALLICTPLPFLMTLAGTPWAAATPLALLLFLVCLARGSRSEGSYEATPSAHAGIPDIRREIPRFAESHPLV